MANLDNLNITVPKDYRSDDILFKIRKKKEPEIKVQKFRSFSISTNSTGTFMIGNKIFQMIQLFELLKEHGLSATIPSFVTLGPTKF